MFGTNSIVGKKWFREKPETTENKLFITSMFMTLQGEGPYRGEPAFFIRLAKCNLDCSFCFVAGTQITMADGSKKPIETIAIGDEVKTWDNGWITQKVTKTFVSQTSELIKMKFNDGTEIISTPNHEFFDLPSNAFIQAKDLHFTGSRIKTDNGVGFVSLVETNLTDHTRSLIKVKENNITSSKWCRITDIGPIQVYNFEVDETHNYVANGLLVHNCDTFFDDGDWLDFDQIEKRIEETIEQFYTDKGINRPKWTMHELDESKKKMVLVMTGGEPMLQDNLGPFLERMNGIFQKTQIESNGTQATEIPTETTLVCSPKCLEKKGVAIKYLEPRREILERADCLKFVMSADETSPYHVVPDWAHKWAVETGKPIFCSPMNIYNDLPQKAKNLRAQTNQISIEERSTVDEVISFWEPGLLNLNDNQANHEYTAIYCVTHGFVLNLQIHLYASLA